MSEPGEVIPGLQNGTVGNKHRLECRPPFFLQLLTQFCARNLMAKDDLKNLGFQEDSSSKKEPAIREKGVQGELQW